MPYIYNVYLILYLGEHRVRSRHVSTAGEVQEGAGPCEDQQSKVETKNDIQAIHEDELFSSVLVFGLVLCSLIFAHNLSFGSVGLFVVSGKAN